MHNNTFTFTLERATSSSSDDVDLLAIDLFASLVQQNEAIIALEATKIIADKFKSTNSNEILQALNVSHYYIINR